MAKKTAADLEKEYQDALKVSSSMVNGLTKLLEANTGAINKKTNAEKGYQKSLKQMIEDTDNAASIQERIARIEQEKASIAKRYFGKNKEIGKIMQDTLSKEQQRLTTVDMVDKKSQGLADTMSGALDGLQSKLGSIPVLGGMLEKITSGPLEKMKASIGDAAKRFVVGFDEASKGGKAGIMGFVKSSIGGFRAMGVAMLTGPQAIIFGLLAVIAAGIAAFAKMEAGAKAFRDETGLLNSQTQQMQTNINNVYMETAQLGASMEDVAKAAADFTNEFGGIEQPAANTMKSMTVLSKNFGVSTQDAAKLNKAFQNMSGMSEEVAQSNLESLTHLAKQAGVAPGKIMADIADSAEEANGFFRGNVQAMGAAAINAAKLGTSLKKAVAVSKGLLNYQSSVSGEMEASAILGTNLNFSQSRYLAAQGDVVGAQSEMVKQLRNSVDLQNLSVFEQEALEKATGMTLGEMQNMARIQELGLSTEGERGKLLQQALKNGMDISKMSKEEINAATDKLALEQERQGKLEAMGNKLSAIGSSLLQAFMPIGEMIVGALGVVMPIIDGVFGVISNAVSSLLNAFKPIKTIFNDIFGGGEAGGFASVMETIGKIIGGPIVFGFNLMANGIKMVISFLEGAYNILKGMVTFDLGMIFDGIMNIGEGLLRKFAAIPMALWDTFKNMFPQLGASIEGFFSGIKEKLKSMIPKGVMDPIIKSVASIKESWNKIKTAFSDAFSQLGAAFKPIKDAFSSIFSGSGESSKFMDTLKSVFSFVGGLVIGTIGRAFGAIAGIVGGIAKVFSGIAGIFSGEMTFGEALMSIGEGLWDMVTAIPKMLWENFTSLFGGIGEWISEKISAGISSIGSSVKSFFGFGGDETEVNDAVISPNGDVVSTAPDDYLIATKDPSGLAAQLAASGDIIGANNLMSNSASEIMTPMGGGIDMSSVVAELKELKQAFLSNKDIYIDNQKVTSRITKTQEKSNINQFGLMGA